MERPIRFPWGDFPEVLIHAAESRVKKHSAYFDAKSGSVVAASELVLDMMSMPVLAELRRQYGAAPPVLLGVHADENAGVNAIPKAMVEIFSLVLGWDVEVGVMQSNTVSHTGADGYFRMGRQAVFSGSVAAGVNYVLVDDFIGQGGTIANLRGHVMAQNGNVVGVTVLTGKDYSAKLVPARNQLVELRRKHGKIEKWWRQRFGFGFECLTSSEVRYLSRSPTSEGIVARVEAIAC
jgi:hypothetical protein